ncbi:hypothetical protein BH09PAT4_BH09PAT4_07180 [soil metagenome]
MINTIGLPRGPWGTPESESLISSHMEQNGRHGIIELYISTKRSEQAILGKFVESPDDFHNLDNSIDTSDAPDEISQYARHMLGASKSAQRAELWFAPTIEQTGGTRVLYLGKVMLGTGLYLPGSLANIALSHPVSNSGNWMTVATPEQVDLLLSQINDLEDAGLKPGVQF